MSLYHPPLLLKSFRDINSKTEINEAINGLTLDYFYTGKREGNSDNITLNVVTVVMDWQENLFIRESEYSGQKDNWKNVIKNQLTKHLQDIGVEDGYVKSETRYFEVSQNKYNSSSEYESKLLDLIAKVKRAE